MRCKLLAIILIIASASDFTAYDSVHSTMAPRDTNVLGIIKHEPESYAPTGPNSIAIHTDELYTRKDFSGDKTTFLWGLVSIKDY